MRAVSRRGREHWLEASARQIPSASGGLQVLIVARALFAIVAPVIAARQSSDRIGALASYVTWSDCGLAAGAFLGIVGMEWAGYPVTYALLGAATLAVTLMWRTVQPQARA